MASKRHARRRECGHKVCFGSMDAGLRRCAWLLASTGNHLHPYACTQCGGIHIGHDLTDVARATRARQHDGVRRVHIGGA